MTAVRRAALRARPRPARRVELRSGTSEAPLHAGRGGAGAAAPVPHRADAGVGARAGGAGRAGRPAPRAARRVGLPAGPVRRRTSPRRPDPGRRRHLPDEDRAAAAPPGAAARRGRAATCATRCGPAASTATPSTPCCGPPGTGSGDAGVAGRADRPRGRGAAAGRPRPVPPADRGAARDLARRPPATTSSASTPRSACRTGRWPACSPMKHGLLPPTTSTWSSPTR